MRVSTKRSRHLATVALLSVAAFACRARTSPEPESMTLSVQNSSDFQINVFAVPNLPSARVRLGTVSPMSDGQLRIPQAALGPGSELKVMVDPIGSTRPWLSPAVIVSSGTTPCLRVHADVDGDLGRSMLVTQVGSGPTCP